MEKSYDLTEGADWYYTLCEYPTDKTVQTIEISGLPLEQNYWIGEVTHYAHWNFATVINNLLREILGLNCGRYYYPLGITANVLGNTDKNHVLRTALIDYGPEYNKPDTHFISLTGEIRSLA